MSCPHIRKHNGKQPRRCILCICSIFIVYIYTYVWDLVHIRIHSGLYYIINRSGVFSHDVDDEDGGRIT